MEKLYYHFAIVILLLGAIFPSVAQQPEALPGRIHVKVSSELASQLDDTGDRPPQTDDTFNTLSQQLNVRQVSRVFPDAGKYEHAHRSYGLHLWYEVTFFDSIPVALTEVLNRYRQLEDIRVAEPVYRMSLNVMPQPAVAVPDPDFGDQWHYENTGQSNGTPGTDIRLKRAWEIEMGREDVIVAILDGGLDPTHDDLAAAMWINPLEANGESGRDDDGNGYVDDIYGYGFGDNRGRITPQRHGIHVGGTVGAVSHNGTGVAGVAGGSGVGDGVRLMSCAVFGRNGQGGFPAAFVYAADNGAVIAQNSWGGGGQSDILEDAIAYFIDRAGYDNSEKNFDKNVQIGPMAGGLVVFAAGNDNSTNSARSYPASLPSVIAVASTDHNDQRSQFSNYGDWVDIAAPGSDILSTYPGNQYDYLSGTSMASPQVSGAAALIVSHYKGRGLRPELVRQALLQSVDNIDVLNAGYEGRLGSGRLNAFQALRWDDEEQPPASITDLTIDAVTHYSALLRWTAPGSDGVEGLATRYELRYATTPITSENIARATLVEKGPAPAAAGTLEQFEIVGLPADETLYFAIVAYDYHQRSSGLSNVVEGQTKKAPIMDLNPTSFTVDINSGDRLVRPLTVSNARGESPLIVELSVSSVGEAVSSNWLELSLQNTTLAVGETNDVTVEFDASDLLEGTYRSSIVVISNDYLRARDTIPVTLNVKGTPFIQVSSQALNFGQLFTGQRASKVVLVSNNGTGPLVITSVTTTNPAYSVDIDTLILPPLSDREIIVTFAPAEAEDYFAELVISSDDEDNGTYEVALTGAALDPPLITTDPASLTLYAAPGQKKDTTLLIGNQEGKSDLLWSIEVRYDDQPNSASSQPWFSSEVNEGAIRPGSDQQIDLRIGANNLPLGRYEATITLTTNDPKNSSILIPIVLMITQDGEPQENKPPVIVDSLSSQTVALREDVYTIDLATSFNDPEGYSLSYSASVGNDEIATSTVLGSILTIATHAVGVTTLTILAEDIYGSSLMYSIEVIVTSGNGPQSSNSPPIAKLVQDQYEIVVDEYLIIKLDTLFSDPEGDSMTYRFIVSDPSLTSTEISTDGLLQVMALQPGQFTITIIATDSKGAKAEATLLATVVLPKVLGVDDPVATSLALSGFPNPMGATMQITYTLTQQEHVRLLLHRVDGMLRTVLLDETQLAGSKRLAWSTQNLAPGLYVLQLVTAQQQESIKLIKH